MWSLLGMIGNALRFVRYSVLCLTVWRPRRGRHSRGMLRGSLTTLAAGIFGGLIITMPLWLLMLGII